MKTELAVFNDTVYLTVGGNRVEMTKGEWSKLISNPLHYRPTGSASKFIAPDKDPA